MLALVRRRILQMVPTLVGITLITFCLFNIVGGDPAYRLAGKYATAQQLEDIREQLGTNRPLLWQYFNYLKECVTLSFGTSWTYKENVNALIVQRIFPTLFVIFPGYVFGIFFSIILALVSTYYHRKTIDYGIQTLSSFLLSINFLLYIIFAQYFLGFYFGVFPLSGWGEQWPQPLYFSTLPWIILCLASLGSNTLFFRNLFNREKSKPYINTVIAKGQKPQRTVGIHLLANVAGTISTLFFYQLPFLLLGSLLLETFFSIPGIGGLLLDSVQNSDLPIIKAITLYGSIAYMLSNLVGDLLLPYFDPRVVHE